MQSRWNSHTYMLPLTQTHIDLTSTTFTVQLHTLWHRPTQTSPLRNLCDSLCHSTHNDTDPTPQTVTQTHTNLTSEKSLRFTVQLQQVILWGLALPWLLFPGFLGCPLSQNGHHISILAHHINISGYHINISGYHINILSISHTHLSVSHKYPTASHTHLRASHKHPKYITYTSQGIT